MNKTLNFNAKKFIEDNYIDNLKAVFSLGNEINEDLIDDIMLRIDHEVPDAFKRKSEKYIKYENIDKINNIEDLEKYSVSVTDNREEIGYRIYQFKDIVVLINNFMLNEKVFKNLAVKIYFNDLKLIKKEKIFDNFGKISNRINIFFSNIKNKKFDLWCELCRELVENYFLLNVIIFEKNSKRKTVLIKEPKKEYYSKTLEKNKFDVSCFIYNNYENLPNIVRYRNFSHLKNLRYFSSSNIEFYNSMRLPLYCQYEFCLDEICSINFFETMKTFKYNDVDIFSFSIGTETYSINKSYVLSFSFVRDSNNFTVIVVSYYKDPLSGEKKNNTINIYNVVPEKYDKKNYSGIFLNNFFMMMISSHALTNKTGPSNLRISNLDEKLIFDNTIKYDSVKYLFSIDGNSKSFDEFLEDLKKTLNRKEYNLFLLKYLL